MGTSGAVRSEASSFELASGATAARREIQASVAPLTRGLERIDALCGKLTKAIASRDACPVHSSAVEECRAAVDHLAMFLGAVTEYMKAVDLADEQARGEEQARSTLAGISPLSSGLAERDAIVAWLRKADPCSPMAMNATRRILAEDIEKGGHLQ